MLLSNPYVAVISLDFSKAFDTVRHSTLLEKLAQLNMPANAYNWLVDFFSVNTLHGVPWSDIDAEGHHSQHHPRVGNRSSDIRG